jgi:hypothetical protein
MNRKKGRKKMEYAENQPVATDEAGLRLPASAFRF